jgi:hypothetical protein
MSTPILWVGLDVHKDSITSSFGAETSSALLEYKLQRRDELDRSIEALALTPRYKPVVDRIACFRGFKTQAAMVLATELGDVLPLPANSSGSSGPPFVSSTSLSSRRSITPPDRFQRGSARGTIGERPQTSPGPTSCPSPESGLGQLPTNPSRDALGLHRPNHRISAGLIVKDAPASPPLIFQILDMPFHINLLRPTTPRKPGASRGEVASDAFPELALSPACDGQQAKRKPSVLSDGQCACRRCQTTLHQSTAVLGKSPISQTPLSTRFTITCKYCLGGASPPQVSTFQRSLVDTPKNSASDSAAAGSRYAPYLGMRGTTRYHAMVRNKGFMTPNHLG